MANLTIDRARQPSVHIRAAPIAPRRSAARLSTARYDAPGPANIYEIERVRALKSVKVRHSALHRPSCRRTERHETDLVHLNIVDGQVSRQVVCDYDLIVAVRRHLNGGDERTWLNLDRKQPSPLSIKQTEHYTSASHSASCRHHRALPQAGGVTDIAGRLIAQKLSERLGHQFYIENISGAGGNIGMANAARSPGDGYTILLASSSIVVNPSLYNKVPYDVDKDFIPVTKAGATPNSWVVNSNFPVQTMKELIDLIKREPGKHSVGSPGTGTTPSLSIEMLKLALGLDFVTVPFQGGGPMTQSLVGGHTPVVCAALGNYVNLIKEGKLRALAVTAKKRSAALPDVPTLEDIGITGQEAETMTGVFVPAGTPKAIVDLLQREISAIVNAPDIKAKLLQAGVEAEGNSPADFAAYVNADIAKWKKVITDAKVPLIGG
jgi:tripartite-type tricarboxylate transporter receptor subunit TctC